MIVAITLVGACSGGGHLQLSTSIDGGAAIPVHVDQSILEPFTADERNALVKFILRAKVGGSTREQARAALLAGVSVTI